MRNSGFRFDPSKARARLKAAIAKVGSPNAFLPELKDFAGRALKEAQKQTPARDSSLIRANQTKQYAHRISYIPSIHTLEDPTLVIREDGTEFLYANGRWYCVTHHQLPDALFADYSMLKAEHLRRLETKRNAFIAERAQARYLYKRVWFEVGQSIGVESSASQAILVAHSRHNPAKSPPKGYAQIRGGKHVLSIAIFTPLFSIPSRYLTFNAADILAKSVAKHASNFRNTIQRKARQILKSA